MVLQDFALVGPGTGSSTGISVEGMLECDTRNVLTTNFSIGWDFLGGNNDLNFFGLRVWACRDRASEPSVQQQRIPVLRHEHPPLHRLRQTPRREDLALLRRPDAVLDRFMLICDTTSSGLGIGHIVLTGIHAENGTFLPVASSSSKAMTSRASSSTRRSSPTAARGT